MCGGVYLYPHVGIATIPSGCKILWLYTLEADFFSELYRFIISLSFILFVYILLEYS